MADDADRAGPNIENMIADGIAKARRELERILPSIGVCHHCGDDVTGGRIFCSLQCSNYWDEAQAARKRNGQ